MLNFLKVEECNGFLELSVAPEFKFELEEEVTLAKGRPTNDYEQDILNSLLEPYWTNGRYYLARPETLGALTGSPLIVSELEYCDDGAEQVPEDVKVWWYPDYQVRSYVNTLLQDGVVRFKEAA